MPRAITVPPSTSPKWSSSATSGHERSSCCASWPGARSSSSRAWLSAVDVAKSSATAPSELTYVFVAAEEVAHLLGITALLLDQPRQRLGLLAKLLLEVGAHESTSETASSDARLPPNAAT